MSRMHVVPIIFMLFQALACSSGQQAQGGVAVAQARNACSQVRELFNIVDTGSVYQQAPEVFLKSVDGLLKTEQDESTELAPELALRQITFAQDPSWLKSAELSYEMSAGNSRFNFAHFKISPNCFEDAHEALQIATEIFGESFSDYEFGPPENVIARTWDRPEPDINYVRFISLSVGEDTAEFKVVRDPAPDEEVGDDEG